MERLRITVEGKAYEVLVEKFDTGSSVSRPAPVARVAAPAAPAPAPVAVAAPKAAPVEGAIASPLAGLVQAINVEVGATVNEGDTVIMLEAMKMYTPINASQTGKITSILVAVGDAVDEGQALYTIG